MQYYIGVLIHTRIPKTIEYYSIAIKRINIYRRLKLNRSSFNKALLILEVIENEKYDELGTLIKLEPFYTDILDLLLEYELVHLHDEVYELSEKGKNILYYFNKMNPDNTPLIRVK